MARDETGNPFIDAWFRIARSYARGVSRETLFPDCDSPETSSRRTRDDLHAERFLSTFHHVTKISEAYAKINQACVTLLVLRFNGLSLETETRETVSRQRRHALDELLQGYLTLSAEYAKLLPNHAGPFRHR